MTLHSHLSPNHTIYPHTHSHLSHPKPHNTTLLVPTHTLRAACQKLLFNCVPEIFLSEYIGTAYAELVIRSVNPQPWRFTNNSLGPFIVCLPVTMSLCCVCMFSSLPLFVSVFRVLRVLCDVHSEPPFSRSEYTSVSLLTYT